MAHRQTVFRPFPSRSGAAAGKPNRIAAMHVNLQNMTRHMFDIAPHGKPDKSTTDTCLRWCAFIGRDSGLGHVGYAEVL